VRNDLPYLSDHKGADVPLMLDKAMPALQQMAAACGPVNCILTIRGVFSMCWWYVPTVGEMSALRSERDQLQASIEDLNQRGGRIKLNSCGNSGDRKRLCVLVDQTAGRFGNAQSGEIYMIAKGY
jgi:hypothetical protein